SALACEGHSYQRSKVVGKDQHNGEHETAGLAAFLGGKAQGNPHQRQNQTSGRQRQPAVKLDQRPAAGGSISGGTSSAPKLDCAQLRDRGWFLVLRQAGGRGHNGNVSLLESRNLVAA